MKQFSVLGLNRPRRERRDWRLRREELRIAAPTVPTGCLRYVPSGIADLRLLRPFGTRNDGVRRLSRNFAKRVKRAEACTKLNNVIASESDPKTEERCISRQALNIWSFRAWQFRFLTLSKNNFICILIFGKAIFADADSQHNIAKIRWLHFAY